MTQDQIAEREQARQRYTERLETICKRYDSDRSRTLGIAETWPIKSHSKEDFDH